MSKHLLLLVSIVSTQYTFSSDYQAVELESSDNETFSHPNIYQNIKVPLSDSDCIKFREDSRKVSQASLRLFTKSLKNIDIYSTLGFYQINFYFNKECVGSFIVKKKIITSSFCIEHYLYSSKTYAFENLKTMYKSIMQMVYDNGAQNNFSEDELYEKKVKVYQKLSKFWQEVNETVASNASEFEVELDMLKNAFQN